jgi:hypothetical protein
MTCAGLLNAWGAWAVLFDARLCCSGSLVSESTAAVAAADTVPETEKDAGVGAGGEPSLPPPPPPPHDAKVAAHAARKNFLPVEKKRDFQRADTDTVSSQIAAGTPAAATRRSKGANDREEGGVSGGGFCPWSDTSS